jgi:hypothetical protein
MPTSLMTVWATPISMPSIRVSSGHDLDEARLILGELGE